MFSSEAWNTDRQTGDDSARLISFRWTGSDCSSLITDPCLNMRHRAVITFNDPSRGSEAYLVPDRIPGRFVLRSISDYSRRDEKDKCAVSCGGIIKCSGFVPIR